MHGGISENILGPSQYNEALQRLGLYRGSNSQYVPDHCCFVSSAPMHFHHHGMLLCLSLKVHVQCDRKFLRNIFRKFLRNIFGLGCLKGPPYCDQDTKMKDIKFLEIRHLRGPNIWTYRPVIEAIVDIGELEDFPSNTPPVCSLTSIVDSVSSLYILLHFPYASVHKWRGINISGFCPSFTMKPNSRRTRAETLPQLLIHTQIRKMPYVGVTWHPPLPMICASYSGAVPAQRARARVQALPLGDVAEP